MRKPHLTTYWHSALTVDQVRDLLELVNKVYRMDELTAKEVEAVENLISVVSDTGYERRRRPLDTRQTSEKLRLASAVSASVGDRLWRKLWGDLRSPVNTPLPMAQQMPILSQNEDNPERQSA
jgi:hypothetical protein